MKKGFSIGKGPQTADNLRPNRKLIPNKLKTH